MKTSALNQAMFGKVESKPVKVEHIQNLWNVICFPPWLFICNQELWWWWWWFFFKIVPATHFSWKGFSHDLLNGMTCWCLFTLLMSLNTRQPRYQSCHSGKASATAEVISICTSLFQRGNFEYFEYFEGCILMQYLVLCKIEASS